MNTNVGIISAIGNTPLIRLDKIMKDKQFKLYMKMEGFNPGGSAKDRSALSMIQNAIDKGEINKNTVIIESSSGNLGISLALICKCLGLKFICVVDIKTTRENLEILKAYGAEIELVDEPDKETGEFLQARINRVNELLEIINNSYRPNQYANIYNPIGHYQTMDEISKALDGNIDYLFCATSTCGTIRGCSEYISLNHLKTKIIAVDAVGSVIFGGKSAKRLLPGHGAAIIPSLYQPNLCDDFIKVTDLDCVMGCRRLLDYEGILAGGSTGAIMTAIERYAEFIEKNASCVMLMHDRGERYLNTIYSEEWVNKNLLKSLVKSLA